VSPGSTHLLHRAPPRGRGKARSSRCCCSGGGGDARERSGRVCAPPASSINTSRRETLGVPARPLLHRASGKEGEEQQPLLLLLSGAGRDLRNSWAGRGGVSVSNGSSSNSLAAAWCGRSLRGCRREQRQRLGAKRSSSNEQHARVPVDPRLCAGPPGRDARELEDRVCSLLLLLLWRHGTSSRPPAPRPTKKPGDSDSNSSSNERGLWRGRGLSTQLRFRRGGWASALAKSDPGLLARIDPPRNCCCRAARGSLYRKRHRLHVPSAEASSSALSAHSCACLERAGRVKGGVAGALRANP
jgi:hypothetical protein